MIRSFFVVFGFVFISFFSFGRVAPLPQVSKIILSNRSESSVDVSWANGSGTNRFVVMSESPISWTPTDGSTYTADSQYGSGQEVSTGVFVVYNGTENAVSVNNLSSTAKYYVRAFEYSYTPTASYVTTTIVGNPTATTPLVASSNINFTNITTTSVTIGFTPGDGESHLIVMAHESSVDTAPLDGDVYTEGDVTTPGYLVVYAGSGTSNIPITGLDPGKSYAFRVFDFNGTSYLITGGVNNPKSVCLPASSYTEQNVCSDSQSSISLLSSASSADYFSWEVTYPAGITGVSNSASETIEISETLHNETASIVNVIYKVTPVSYSCGVGAFYEITVPILPSPIIQVNNTAPSISNGGTTNITFSDALALPGVVFSFEASDNSDISGASNDSGNTITQTLQNNGTTQSYIYYLYAEAANGCSGSENAEVVVASGQSSNITFTNVTKTSATISFTPGDGPEHLVVVRHANYTAEGQPSNGTDYAVDALFAGDNIESTAQEIGGSKSGNFGIYKGTQSSGIPVNGLQPDTEYMVRVYDYDATTHTYKLTPEDHNPWSFTTLPLIQTSNIIFNNRTTTSVDISFAPGNGVGRVVVMKAGSPVDYFPYNDLSNYTANPVFGGGTDIGGGNFVVYNGNGNAVSVTGLTPSENYYVRVFEWHGTGAGLQFQQETSENNPRSFAACLAPAGNNTAMTVCSDATFNINPSENINNGIGGVTFDWEVTEAADLYVEPSSGPGNVSATVKNIYSDAGDVVYTFTPSAGGCTGETFTVTVTINPEPVFASKQSAASICSGSAANYVVSMSNTPTGTTLSWPAPTTQGTAGIAVPVGAAFHITDVLTTGNESQTVEYVITPTSGAGCQGDSKNFIIGVNPVPDVTISNLAPVISHATATLISLTSNVSATTFEYNAGTPANVSGNLSGVSASGSVSAQLFNKTAVSQTITFTITPKAGNCYGASKTTDVTVNASPLVVDSVALVALYNATNGPGWTNHTNWLTGTLETWNGVTVDGNRVTSIILVNNNLAGTIPAAVGELTELTQINFGQNKLAGAIPLEIFNLSKLQFLRLYENSLTGAIPPQIANLTSLQTLNLYKNQLSGNLPSELWNMTGLKNIDISDNQFTGTIPPAVGNLTSLLQLIINNNQFTGTIPAEIGNLTGLTSNLRLDGNQFTGSLPSTLNNLVSIPMLDVSNNQFSGAVPSLSNLTALKTLNVSNNNFTDLPDVSSLSALTSFIASNNLFSFDDLEPNKLKFVASTDYAPQKPFSGAETRSISIGKLLEITFGVGGTSDSYQWTKDANVISTSGNTYSVSSFAPSNAGVYTLTVTNSQLPGLTLTSGSVTVTVSAPIDYYWVGNGGDWNDIAHWSLASGGTNGAGTLPGPNDNVFFDSKSFNQPGQVVTITDDGSLIGVSFKSMDWRGVSNNPTFRIKAVTSEWVGNTVNGSLYFDSNMTLDFNAAEFYMSSDVDYEFDVRNLPMGNRCYLAFFGRVNANILSDINHAWISVYGGTLNFNGHSFVDQHDDYPGLHLSGTASSPVTVDISNSNIDLGSLSISSFSTLIDDNATITVRNKFTSKGQDFNYVKMAASVTMQATGGDNTFGTLEILPGADVKLLSAATQTVGNLIAKGTAAQPISLMSATGGTAASISKVGGTVNTKYVHLKDVAATGGAVFNAIDSWDEGNNTGWNFLFTSSPADSLAMVDLYNATNGMSWTTKTNWLTGPVNTWFGVTFDHGRIDKVKLSDNNLDGTLPSGLSVLDKLTQIDLSKNKLTGAIPTAYNGLASAKAVNLADNALTGTVPALGARVRYLHLEKNKLNSLPAVSDSTVYVNVSANQLDNLGNLSGKLVDTLFVQNNKLTFEDLEPNVSIADFKYDSQDSIGVKSTFTRFLNEAITLTNVQQGTANQYQWKKNEVAVTGATTSNLVFSSLGANDDAVYRLEVSNTKVPGLVLQGRPVTLKVSFLRRDSLALVSLYDSANGAAWTNKTNWKTGPFKNWFGVNIANYKVTALALPSNNLRGNVPALITSMDGLQTVDISGNKIKNLPNLTSLVGITSLKVQNNQLDFGDLEANVAIKGITYAPQDSVDVRESYLKQVNENQTFNAVTGGTANSYQWKKNNVAIAGSTKPSITLSNIAFADDAVYSYEVTSSKVAGLTLVSYPKIIRVSSLKRDSIALRSLYLSTGGANWTNKTNWITTPIGTGAWFGVTISNNRVTAVSLPNNNLTGKVPAVLGDVVNMTSLNLSSNKLQSLPDLKSLAALTTFNVSGNQLDFASLIPNVAIKGINYASQADVGTVVNEQIDYGKDFTVKISTKGAGNVYQWKRAGTAVAGATDSLYVIKSMNRNNMGEYVAEVTNASVPGLTLKSAKKTVNAVASLSGKLLASANTGARKGKATLFRVVKGSGYDTISVKDIGTDGAFKFEKVVLGDYEVLGFVDTLTYSKALPTYYGKTSSTIYWEEASTIAVDENVSDINVTTQYKPTDPPTGTGVISGYLEFDDGKGRIKAKQRVDGAGASVRRVERTGRPQGETLTLVAYVFTDADGYFVIPKLSKGEYRLNLQIPGYPMDENSFITMTIGDGLQSQTKVAATVQNGVISVKKLTVTGVWEESGYVAEAYPNPSSDFVNVKFNETSSSRSIEMLDGTGRSLLVQAAGEKDNTLDVQPYSSGVYFLRVRDKNAIVKVLRLVIVE